LLKGCVVKIVNIGLIPFNKSFGLDSQAKNPTQCNTQEEKPLILSQRKRDIYNTKSGFGQLGLEFLNSLGGIKYMSNGFDLSTCELNFAMIVST
jgi:hypothetical protein